MSKAGKTIGSWAYLAGLVVALQWGTACRTAAPLSPVDLSAPGWKVQQGQALWKPAKDKTELAGELLMATNSTGDFYIEFTKNPFPVVTAQIQGGHWRIEFGGGKYSFGGRGQPPSRFAWFELPPALAGGPLNQTWHFKPLADGAWRLENSHTGEWLEGSLAP